MTKDITKQLIELAASLDRQEGRSTIVGAVNEIESLRVTCEDWKNIASLLYNDLIEGSEYNFESSRIYEESIKNY